MSASSRQISPVRCADLAAVLHRPRINAIIGLLWPGKRHADVNNVCII
jgi:hypothetical protein